MTMVEDEGKERRNERGRGGSVSARIGLGVKGGRGVSVFRVLRLFYIFSEFSPNYFGFPLQNF